MNKAGALRGPRLLLQEVSAVVHDPSWFWDGFAVDSGSHAFLGEQPMGTGHALRPAVEAGVEPRLQYSTVIRRDGRGVHLELHGTRCAHPTGTSVENPVIHRRYLSLADYSRMQCSVLLAAVEVLLREFTEYSKRAGHFLATRKTSTGSLVKLKVVQHQLASIFGWLDVCKTRLMEIKAASSENAGGAVQGFTGALLKALRRTADDLVQLFGAAGYLAENPVAQAYRDMPLIESLLRPFLDPCPVPLPDLPAPRQLSLGAGRPHLEQSFPRFLEQHVKPHYAEWTRQDSIPRTLLQAFGSEGFLSLACPRALGGGGGDTRHNMFIAEEMMRRGYIGLAITTLLIANAACLLFAKYGSREQQQSFLPKLISGELIPCLAASEPGCASDMVHTLETRAVCVDSGYRISGTKSYITNGPISDVALVLARSKESASAQGQFSLFIVDAAIAGFTAEEQFKLGAPGSKIGLLRFDDCQVDESRLLGRAGMGFIAIVDVIVQERLLIATGSAAFALARIEEALEIEDLALHHRSALTDCWNALAMMRSHCWAVGKLAASGKVITADTAMLKWLVCDHARESVEQCYQATLSAPSAGEERIRAALQARLDARVLSLFAGASDTMRALHGARIAKGLEIQSAANP